MQEAIATARQRRPFTILGMLLALITLGAFIFVATRQGGTPVVNIPTGGTQSVVVAKVDIPARATITADMLTVGKLNVADVPTQSFTKVSDVAASKTTHFALI